MNRLQNLQTHFITKSKPFANKTIVISGASRGIGLGIAKICAKDGANIVILAKTTQTHPKLPGTIYSAAKQIQQLGGKALPLQCDIRSQQNVKQCINKAIQKFGGIDILINNASAINLSNTEDTPMKKYDLMHQVNIRGTFLLSKTCLPYLKKSSNPHILNISPPLNIEAKWFAPHVAYTIAKYGMSLCVLGMAEEFKQYGIAVNALWPKTSIATAAVKNLLTGDEGVRKSRTQQIMADSAYIILSSNSKKTTGKFFVDEHLLREHGVKDFSKYKVDPTVKDEDIMPDFFV